MSVFHKQPGEIANVFYLRHFYMPEGPRMLLISKFPSVCKTDSDQTEKANANFNYRIVCRGRRKPNRECVQVLYNVALEIQSFILSARAQF